MKNKTLRITYAAICLAASMVFPFIASQIPRIGNLLCPMHLPVLLCGFICGWQYGMLVGFTAPILRFAVFGTPVLFPSGIGMAFELAAYGALTGILYKKLGNKPVLVYISLIISMIGGRIIWGIVRVLIAGLSGTEFPVSAFISGALTDAIPGIVLQIAVIPPLVFALGKAHLLPGGDADD